jgi:hypothetical protein
MVNKRGLLLITYEIGCCMFWSYCAIILFFKIVAIILVRLFL